MSSITTVMNYKAQCMVDAITEYLLRSDKAKKLLELHQASPESCKTIQKKSKLRSWLHVI